MKTGNARAPALSPDIVEMVKQAWLLASVEQGASRVRSGHLMWALLADDMLARRAIAIVGPSGRHRARYAQGRLSRDLRRTRVETAQATTQAAGSEAAGTGSGESRPGSSAALDQFTIDLTAQARAGKIDPILGRDFEIRQMVDILTRRRQNNPILTGEAGVGKTAVVEGPGAAHRRRRRAAGAAQRHLAHPRSRPAAGRRGREGRIREPPEIGDRGDQGQPEADHPVHRRGAHADRRRRPGRPERRGQSAEAGAGARRAADDRRDDLGRIQEVLREGRRPRPAASSPSRSRSRASRWPSP